MLQHESLALFWSIQCPGNLILQMYAFAQNWRNKDVPVISGFHTPMESECLRILLRGAQPITSLSRKLGSRQILPEIVKGFRFPLFLIEHYDNSSVDKLPLSVDK